MIDKGDILARAAEWGLPAGVVEKDYVLGWLLAAIALHPVAGNLWVFKGGTCLKKCYLETYRFSEDIDFTFLPGAPYEDADVAQTLGEVCAHAYELSGIEFPPELNQIDSLTNRAGQPTYMARLSYRGPLQQRGSLPRVIVDITRHETIVATPVRREIFHPYPDRLPDGARVLAYSLEELLAEKARALRERTRPRDLYDVVYLGENSVGSIDIIATREICREKCRAKGLEPLTPEGLIEIARSDVELLSEWANMLAHQLPSLPDLSDYIGRLPHATRWLVEVPTPEAPLPVATAGAEYASTSSIEFRGGGTPLENLRFAGANRLLVEFQYHGKHRFVEPYSLRMSGPGNLLLYAWEVNGTNIKAFNVYEIQGLRITDQPFTPKFQVELAPGHVAIPSTRASYRFPSATISRRRTSGPIYVFECTYCGKKFRRSRRVSRLNKHVMRGGYYACSGRTGMLVDTIY